MEFLLIPHNKVILGYSLFRELLYSHGSFRSIVGTYLASAMRTKKINNGKLTNLSEVLLVLLYHNDFIMTAHRRWAYDERRPCCVCNVHENTQTTNTQTASTRKIRMACETTMMDGTTLECLIEVSL